MADALEIKYRPQNWIPRATMRVKKPWNGHRRGTILEVVGEDNIKELLRLDAKVMDEPKRVVEEVPIQEKELEKIITKKIVI